MASEKSAIPPDPLAFIRQCIKGRRLLWTYHVNMRLKTRSIPHAVFFLFSAVETYEIVESYPGDKYLPSYLVRAEHEEEVFHLLFATDLENDNVRVVTIYRPDPEFWTEDFRRRKEP